MARVLLAWEFGSDLGHVRRLLPLAERLRGRGHEPLLAVRDLEAVARQGAVPFEVLQAPMLPPPASQSPSPLNACDVLLNLGFAESGGLAATMRAWRCLYELMQPQLVVADYAPTALLAAGAAKLARVTVGSGFALPRPGRPMPALRNWSATEPTALQRLDERLVHAVREAFDRLRAPHAPAQAAAVFDADAHLLCTDADVDPFGPRDGVEYLGPQDEGGTLDRLAWRGDARPRIFAYLKPRDPRFAALLDAMRRTAGEAIVVAPGLAEPDAVSLTHGNVRISTRPLDLPALLAAADLCVSHAGPGVAAHALRAGTPMALLPSQLEQFLIARRLVQQGVATMLDPEAPSPAFDAWLSATLEREDLRAAAQARAARGGFARGDAAARIAALLER